MKPHSLVLFAALAAAASATGSPHALWEHAAETTSMARKLLLARIDAIAATGSCRASFGREQIDLDRVRRFAEQIRFYDAEGAEGQLKFSEVVGRPASPDHALRDLARGLSADAFVLGYRDGARYVRTRHVVLAAGYSRQGDPQDGTWRPTTEDEKQALLLHEVLHVALNVDDDDLSRRDLCPLRLLAFCPRSRSLSRVGAE